MVALVAGRLTKEVLGPVFQLPVAAATLIYAGALVCVSAAGFATKGATSTTLKAYGRCETTVDNSAGAAGDLKVTVKSGIFIWANSAAGDLITLADVASDCYIVDDQTVAKTNGGATRSRAGKIVNVDAEGVWVQVSPQN